MPQLDRVQRGQRPQQAGARLFAEHYEPVHVGEVVRTYDA